MSEIEKDIAFETGKPPANDAQDVACDAHTRTRPPSCPEPPEKEEDHDELGRTATGGHGVPEPPPDLEALAQVPSGPAYTVFSPGMIRWIVIMNFFSVFFSPLTANIYFPALPALANDLGVSTSQINLSLTTYMIFQGLSPTVFGDFGDAAGRRPAFLITMVIYIGANIGLALQRNFVALLILRMLQSGGSSGTLALCYAVMADISQSHERGKYMGIVGAGITVGPALGPIMGGILSQYLGWPSIFWGLTILSVIFLVPYALAVPETCRNVVGNGSIPAQGWNMTLLDYLRFRRESKQHPVASKPRQKIPIPNPFNTLKVVFEKDMGMLLFYNSMLYLGFIIVSATLSDELSELYGLSELEIGLCFFPLGVASIVSSIGFGYLLDWNFRRTAHKLGLKIDRKLANNLKDFPVERTRLQIIYPMLCVGTVAYVGYAWALQVRAHVAVPLILTFFIGLGITGSFSIINTLLVDLYPQAPATATAANNLVRCVVGAIATAVIQDVKQRIGRGWAYTIIAFVFTACSPILWVIQKYGPTFREARRQRMLKKAKLAEAEQREEIGDSQSPLSDIEDQNPLPHA